LSLNDSPAIGSFLSPSVILACPNERGIMLNENTKIRVYIFMGYSLIRDLPAKAMSRLMPYSCRHFKLLPLKNEIWQGNPKAMVRT
jgi:hypothetical protein